MLKNTETLLADVIYYDKETCEPITLKNCSWLTDFMFSRIDFMLFQKNNTYHVCASKDGMAISLWSISNPEKSPSEALSAFRDGFTRNSITSEMVELFLNAPQKYKKKYVKSTKKAK